MKRNNLLFLLITGFIALVSITSGPGCANIIPPTGGPRDSLPPELVAVRPADSSMNFASNRITFEFNEFVELDNIRENLLVSPLPKTQPIVTSRLRTVTVTVKDTTFEDNTTYTLDFGKAIKDINEGNPLVGFKYIFTTGDHLDSLEITGKVIIAESGKIDSTLIIMLHSNFDDSAVINEAPRYIARVDRNGNFHFYNLPPATYAIYALEDQGGQHKYLSTSQLFAFSDSVVTSQLNPQPVTLYAYTEPDTTAPTSTPAPRIPNRGNQARDNNRLRIETSLVSNELDLLDSLKINFPLAPLAEFDTTKISLTNNEFQPLTGYYFLRDTGNQKFTLLYNWQPNTAYNLILDTAFAVDTAGRRILRTDTLAFHTKKESDYGELRLRLLNLDLSKNPVLQFVQSNKVVHSYVLTSREYNVKLFKPGEYDLRILYDENQNGIWDAGSFFGIHRQPEKVIPLSRKLTVKANWNNQVDITLEENSDNK